MPIQGQAHAAAAAPMPYAAPQPANMPAPGPNGSGGGAGLITQSADWGRYRDDGAVWKESDWVIPIKVTKELGDHPFGGDIASYKRFHTAFVNHVLYQRQGYGKILHLAERCREPITFAELDRFPYVDGLPVDLRWVTKHLWTFLVRHLAPGYRESINALVNGETMNGLELWRVMYVQCRGGAERVALAEQRSLHRFPRCTQIKHLAQYLGEFTIIMNNQGNGLPDSHKVAMLTEMLPKKPSMSSSWPDWSTDLMI